MEDMESAKWKNNGFFFKTNKKERNNLVESKEIKEK